MTDTKRATKWIENWLGNRKPCPTGDDRYQALLAYLDHLAAIAPESPRQVCEREGIPVQEVASGPGLHVTCDICGAPLVSPGALTFSPPNVEGRCVKRHVCAKCWGASDVMPPAADPAPQAETVEPYQGTHDLRIPEVWRDHLREEYAAWKVAFNAEHDRAAAAERERDEAREEACNLRKSSDNYVDSMTLYINGFRLAVAERDQAKRTAAQSESERLAVTEQLASEQMQHATTRMNLDQSQTSYRAASDALETAQRERDEARAECEWLRADAERGANAVDDLHELVWTPENHPLGTVEATCTAAVAELRRLRATLAGRQELIDAMEAHGSASAEELRDLRERIAALSADWFKATGDEQHANRAETGGIPRVVLERCEVWETCAGELRALLAPEPKGGQS